jgi:hypothetical protein
MKVCYNLRECCETTILCTDSNKAMDEFRNLNWPSVSSSRLIDFLYEKFPYHIRSSRITAYEDRYYLLNRFSWLEETIGPSAIKDGRHAPLYWTSGLWNFCGRNGEDHFVFMNHVDAVAFKMRWG